MLIFNIAIFAKKYSATKKLNLTNKLNFIKKRKYFNKIQIFAKSQLKSNINNNIFAKFIKFFLIT